MDEFSTAYVNWVCQQIALLREEIVDGHDRADQLYADAQALASEAVTNVTGEPLGLLLMRLRWQYGNIVEPGIVASALRITPQQARDLVETVA